MLAVEHADRGRQKRDPDQQIARHFLGPGHRLAEAVAGDDRDDDDDEQRGGQHDADQAHRGDQQRREAVEQIQKVHGIFP